MAIDFEKKTLEEAGVTFHFVESVELSKIDFINSQKNQARLSDPIIADVKDRYKIALQNKDEFGAVILETVKNKYFILDGNHRLQAAKEVGFSAWPFGAYIIDEMGSAQRKGIIYRANLRHGEGISQEDRFSHAIEEVNLGCSIKLTAAKYYLTAGNLEQRYRAQKALERGVAMNIKNVSKLKHTALLFFSSISYDEIFKAAIECAIKSAMNTDECKDFVQRLKSFKSMKSQLKFINDYIVSIRSSKYKEEDSNNEEDNGYEARFRSSLHNAQSGGSFAKSIKSKFPNIAELLVEDRLRLIGALESSTISIAKVVRYLQGN